LKDLEQIDKKNWQKKKGMNAKEFLVLLPGAINRRITHAYNSLFAKREPKFFCIGQNKTGTTTLKAAFERLGYFVGNQRTAEKLSRKYFRGDFSSIIEYCKTARVFQDVPFSWPETFKHLDHAFPNAKFILSVRDSAEQCFNSLKNFHTKREGHLPTAQDFKDSRYVWKGWQWECFSGIYGGDETDMWNKERFIKHYNQYNESVIDYFKDRPEKLLVINVAQKEDYKRFCEFVGAGFEFDDFPWENKT
jgi:hypothetical protein